MSFMNKLTELAQSEKGRELIDKAQAIANDPRTREKLDVAREMVEGTVESARTRLAQKQAEREAARGDDDPPQAA